MANYVEFNSDKRNKGEYNILKYNEDFTEKFREVEKRIFMLHINERQRFDQTIIDNLKEYLAKSSEERREEALVGLTQVSKPRREEKLRQIDQEYEEK